MLLLLALTRRTRPARSRCNPALCRAFPSPSTTKCRRVARPLSPHSPTLPLSFILNAPSLPKPTQHLVLRRHNARGAQALAEGRLESGARRARPRPEPCARRFFERVRRYWLVSPSWPRRAHARLRRAPHRSSSRGGRLPVGTAAAAVRLSLIPARRARETSGLSSGVAWRGVLGSSLALARGWVARLLPWPLADRRSHASLY